TPPAISASAGSKRKSHSCPRMAYPSSYFASSLRTGGMSQRSQRIGKLFDTGLLHQVLRFACLLEVAPDNQPVHFLVDVRQVVWCWAAANENRQGRMLADNGNIFRACRSAGIIARYNDGVGEPALS